MLIPDEGPDSSRALVGPFLTASDCASYEEEARTLLFPTKPCRNQETFKDAFRGFLEGNLEVARYLSGTKYLLYDRFDE